ncbi:uncharacterized protein LOC106876238 [Octopus bimaculoides]|uniref:uncharacterized protein LOC106876238 n=1 Tax=Octopus bimaculoides TaxID=37653 RepID=UPI00071D5673|nr:uncharacterized protein LOC106876238 [Octopus bimaculoides]|eukprot:XP_014780205.1 PREDICTED: uncharacterized protein LOC106876238 [Octopus bimaculoides]
MSDQSPYTIEERLVAAVWMHDRVLNNKKIPEIRRLFQERFGKPSPTPRILREWEKKVFETGSVLDAPRCGRPRTRFEHLTAIQESLIRSPSLSMRKRSAELQIPKSTLRKILKLDLPQDSVVYEVQNIDEDTKVEVCRVMFQKFPFFG